MAKNLEKRILDAASRKKTLNEGEGNGISWEDAGPAITRPTDSGSDYTKGVPSQQLRPMDKKEVSDISGARDPKGKITFADIDEEDSKDIQDDDVEDKRKLAEDTDDDDDKDKDKDDIDEDMALASDVSDAHDRGDQVKPSQIDEEDDSEDDDDDKDKDKKDDKKDVNEDVNALFAGEKNLSQAFKKKASVIFEAAVRVSTKAAVLVEKAKLEKRYQKALTEETNKLAAKVDKHLNYVSDKWLEENKIAIEGSLRSQLTEDFINGLKSLFEDHYIDVPHSKINVVETLAAKVQKLEESLNDTLESSVTLKEENEVLRKKMIFEQVVRDSKITGAQADKVKQLAEEMEFKGAKTYRQYLNSIVESLSGKPTSKQTALNESIMNNDVDGDDDGFITESNDSDIAEFEAFMLKDKEWRLE